MRNEKNDRTHVIAYIRGHCTVQANEKNRAALEEKGMRSDANKRRTCGNSPAS
jgi:hypothetical protein